MAENESGTNERQTFAELAKLLSRLPADKRRAAVETGAALASVSLRVSRDFAEAVPPAAAMLSAEEIRAWGEFGRKLAMGSAETGSHFFLQGVNGLSGLSPEARHYVFEICTRQLVLSSSIALATFDFIPDLADEVSDEGFLTDILRLASDVASRSARHSADFLRQSPEVARAVRGLSHSGTSNDIHPQNGIDVVGPIVSLASHFAVRTGGMTADLWSNLPKALEGLTDEEAVKLAQRAGEFLDHGGSVTLHFVSAGGAVLRAIPEIMDDWCLLLTKIAKSGNAVLIAFLRATPTFFKQIGRFKFDGAEIDNGRLPAVRRVLKSIMQIAESDAESAIAAFRSSTSALRLVSLDQYEEWIETGLEKMQGESTKARRGYFALETRQSNDLLRKTRTGLQLDTVQHILRLYIEALTGREIEIAARTSAAGESRIGDGKTIHLPSSIAEFDTEEMDFRIYKALAAHGAGQIEFGTFAKDTPELKAIYAELQAVFSETAEQRDAFSLAGYIEDVQTGENSLSTDWSRDERDRSAEELPPESDYRVALKVFPEPRLAGKIFGTMENARIDSCLRAAYRGLRKDLDLMRDFLRKSRPYIFDVPAHLVPFELLFQITLCGGATDDARQFYGPVVSEIETIVDQYLLLSGEPIAGGEGLTDGKNLTTVADSLYATSRVYNLFQNISPEQTQESEPEKKDQQGGFAYEDKEAEESVSEDKVKREERPKSALDLRELFSAWNSDDEGEPDDMDGAESWSRMEMPEQSLESGDEAFSYDEWDRELNDYRIGWSRVIEKKVKEGDRNFVELARSRYRGVISSVRHQFQLMKPENLTKINRELDGEDYDLSALVDFVIDRRADGRQSENIYTKRLRRRRDVAVSILLDQSSSTARTITRNPLQPYTFPGRRIIEIEKEGLVLMSEALEAVGDVYSINGFTSEGRRNVKFYVVKDFDEKYSEEVEKRIGGITFQNNTRLGAAIRHAAAKLLRQESRTKLMIILTDGRPYDHDYGDARYAREDVREALIEAKISGITPFCITIDRESEAELKDLYGDVGYTIIDDVLSLPERMPNIYRRLTS